MRRTRFARTRGERVHGLPRGCQPSLRFTEILFDDSLLFCEPGDRHLRVRAAGLERGSFLFGAPSLHRHEVRLARQTQRVFGGAGELCVVPDERLLVNVLLFLEHADRAGGFDDARVEAGDLGRQLRQHLSIAFDALAQLLDLTTGGQDAARLDLRATGHEMRPTEYVALDRRDRRERLVRERHRLLETLGDVCLGNDLQNRGSVGAADTENIRNRHDARRMKSVVRVVSVGSRFHDDESATAGVLLSNE